MRNSIGNFIFGVPLKIQKNVKLLSNNPFLNTEFASVAAHNTSSFGSLAGSSRVPACVLVCKLDISCVSATTFFLSKIEKDLAHGGICCSRRRVKMTSRKRQPRDGANFAPSHFFAKKRKIDSFPSLISPKKCEKRECRRAKMAS